MDRSQIVYQKNSDVFKLMSKSIIYTSCYLFNANDLSIDQRCDNRLVTIELAGCLVSFVLPRTRILTLFYLIQWEDFLLLLVYLCRIHISSVSFVIV